MKTIFSLLMPKQATDYIEEGISLRNVLERFKYHKFSVVPVIDKEGKYKGTPKRTTAGGVWLNGFSDHLPVVLYLLKEQK